MIKPRISVIIKALNEEDNIARCIESCLQGTKDYEREIILVDSLSTDRTVQIAKEYPITIIQFLNKADASCGSAPQLGYQHSTGDYIFLIDGDMELKQGFIGQAFNEFDVNPLLAGVSGVVEDAHMHTSADARRMDEYASMKASSRVISLGGGGLYKRSAIESVGYFSNQSLKACEELELGVRLISKGYQLTRLTTPSVMHTGHVETDMQSLYRLWSTGRIEAYSVFLKSSIGKSWFFLAFKKCWFLYVAPFSLLITAIVGMREDSLLALETFLTFWVGSFLYLAIKRRSVFIAVNSIAAWWLFSIAAIRGFSQVIIDPLTEIPSSEI